MDSFGLVECTSLKASRTLLQTLLACSNFTLDSEDLFYMAAAQAAKNHADERGLT